MEEKGNAWDHTVPQDDGAIEDVDRLNLPVPIAMTISVGEPTVLSVPSAGQGHWRTAVVSQGQTSYYLFPRASLGWPWQVQCR